MNSIYVQYGIEEVCPWGVESVWVDTKTITGTRKQIREELHELKIAVKSQCFLPSHKVFIDVEPLESLMARVQEGDAEELPAAI